MSKPKKDKERLIKFDVEDYVLVKLESKKLLLQVTKKSDNMCSGLVEKLLPYEEKDTPFEPTDVIANFGQNPEKAGYEAFYRKTSIPEVGSVAFFTKVSSTARDEVRKTLEKGYSQLKKRHLVSFFPLNLEIRPEKGKSLGHYKLDKKTDIDTLCLRINSEQTMLESFYHECGHGIWERMIYKRSTKSKWIQAYNSLIEVQKLTSKQLKGILNDLQNLRCNITEYKASLEDESEVRILKEALSYIKKYHRLDTDDLNSIIENGDFDVLSSVWPTDSLALTKVKESGITAYASKSVKEFFCESLAFYLMGKALPSNVKSLMEKTVTSIASK